MDLAVGRYVEIIGVVVDFAVDRHGHLLEQPGTEPRIPPNELEPHIQQRYDLFLGEVIAAQADARVFADGRWNFTGHDELRTLHHVAGGHFIVDGEAVDARPLAPVRR